MASPFEVGDVHGQDLEDESEAEGAPRPRSQLVLVGAVVALYFVCQTLVICAITSKTPGGYSDDYPVESVLETMRRRCDRHYVKADGGFLKAANASWLSAKVQAIVQKRLTTDDLRRNFSVTYHVCGSKLPPRTYTYNRGLTTLERTDGSPLTEIPFVDDSLGYDVAIAYRVLPDYVDVVRVNKVSRLFVEAMKICLPMPTLFTLAVFWYLPQLRNLQGKIIVCKLVSDLVNSLCSWFVHEEHKDGPHFVLVCSCMAGITWTTVLCYDLWNAVCSRVPKSTTSPGNGRRFFFYSLIGWGHPVSLVSLVTVARLNILGDFKFGTGVILSVVYIFLNLLNAIFFAFTVKSLKRHNSRHRELLKKGRREGGSTAGGFYFYFRICGLMGVLSFVFDIVHVILSGFVYYEDGIFNAVLLGFALLDKILTFVILVCNKRVIGLMEKKRKSEQGSGQIS